MKHCTRCKDRGDLPAMLTERGLTGIGVELGVRRGEFSEIMLSRWPGTLHMVDPWCPQPEYVELEAHGFTWDDTEDHRRAVEVAGQFGDRGVVQVCTSLEASRILPDGLDFVYIDANHAYQFVWQDLRLWWPKLRLGGVLAGHDMIYYPLPDVTQAVIEFSVRHDVQVMLIPGSSDNKCRDGQVCSWYIIKE